MRRRHSNGAGVPSDVTMQQGVAIRGIRVMLVLWYPLHLREIARMVMQRSAGRRSLGGVQCVRQR